MGYLNSGEKEKKKVAGLDACPFKSDKSCASIYHARQQTALDSLLSESE